MLNIYELRVALILPSQNLDVLIMLNIGAISWVFLAVGPQLSVSILF